MFSDAHSIRLQNTANDVVPIRLLDRHLRHFRPGPGQTRQALKLYLWHDSEGRAHQGSRAVGNAVFTAALDAAKDGQAWVGVDMLTMELVSSATMHYCST